MHFRKLSADLEHIAVHQHDLIQPVEPLPQRFHSVPGLAALADISFLAICPCQQALAAPEDRALGNYEARKGVTSFAFSQDYGNQRL